MRVRTLEQTKARLASMMQGGVLMYVVIGLVLLVGVLGYFTYQTGNEARIASQVAAEASLKILNMTSG